MSLSMKRFALVLGIAVSLLVFFSSCMTYTHEEAKRKISAAPSIPETPPTPTKLSEQPSSLQEKEPAQPEAPVVTERVEDHPIISFSAALVPLPSKSTTDMLDTIIAVAEQSETDIIGFTGESEALVYVGRHIGIPTYWTTDGQLLATDFPVDMLDAPIARIYVDDERTIRLSIVDLHQSNTFQSLYSEPSPAQWSTLVEEANSERIPKIAHLLEHIDNGPILVLASLGEPSGSDWLETAEDHPYRIRLRWPLVESLEENRYLDSWRLTHHNPTTSPGSTWELTTRDETLAERVDYLFQKGLLPIETNTIPINLGDTKKFPYEQRSAVTGTFVVP